MSGFAWPGFYSDTKSGRIVDQSGAPLGGTYIFTQVYRECGSLGGATHERLKSSFVVADDEGRYKRRVSGATWLYVIPAIAGCSGYAFHDYACRGGFGCTAIKNGDGGDFVLKPQERGHESILNLPPEIRSDAVFGCAQEKRARSGEVPGWIPSVRLKYRWFCTPDIYPMVEVEDPGVAAWIKYRTVARGGKQVVTIKLLPPGKYVDDGMEKGAGSSTYLFALGNKGSGMRPIAALVWGVRQSSVSGPEPVAPGTVQRNAWNSMLYAARGQVPPEILERLPNSAQELP